MPRRPRRFAAAQPQEVLHFPIFQRVKRHHHQAAARRQQPFSGNQPAVELSEFIVDPDAQRLERPCRRVQPVGTARTDLNDIGELQRIENGRLDASAHDRRGDAARRPFLAEGIKNVRKLVLRQMIDSVAGGRAVGRVHAHVERAC